MSWVAGIDVSKQQLHVSVLDSNGEWLQTDQTVPNHPEGFKALDHLLPSGDGLVAYEASGGYEKLLTQWLQDHSEHSSVCLNPYRVQSFARAQGSKSKTDAVDARMIAQFAQMNNVEGEDPEPESHRKLRELTRHLEHLKERRQQEINDRDSIQDPRRKDDANQAIDLYDEQIEQVKKELDEWIEEHPELNNNIELITSIPGIGEEVARRLLAELQNADHPHKLDPKQEVAHAGLDPQIEQSGTSLDHSRISKQGNPRIREALYFPALVAIQHNPIIEEFYERLISRGKAKMVAVCASMRKLLHIVVGVLKNQAPFDPNRDTKRA